MKAKYRLSNKAAQDLDGILDYTIKEFGHEQAKIYTTKLSEILTVLTKNPQLSPERTEFEPPIRLFPCGVHHIVYVSKAEDIFVVRILHQKMDLARYLSTSE